MWVDVCWKDHRLENHIALKFQQRRQGRGDKSCSCPLFSPGNSLMFIYLGLIDWSARSQQVLCAGYHVHEPIKFHFRFCVKRLICESKVGSNHIEHGVTCPPMMPSFNCFSLDHLSVNYGYVCTHNCSMYHVEIWRRWILIEPKSRMGCITCGPSPHHALPRPNYWST